jgi:hypothetical protein
MVTELNAWVRTERRWRPGTKVFQAARDFWTHPGTLGCACAGQALARSPSRHMGEPGIFEHLEYRDRSMLGSPTSLPIRGRS